MDSEEKGDEAMTLKVGRMEYHLEPITGSRMYAYRVHGKRGAIYHLARNVNNPKLLFPVNVNGGFTCGALEGLWFEDTDDGVRQVSLA